MDLCSGIVEALALRALFTLIRSLGWCTRGSEGLWQPLGFPVESDIVVVGDRDKEREKAHERRGRETSSERRARIAEWNKEVKE